MSERKSLKFEDQGEKSHFSSAKVTAKLLTKDACRDIILEDAAITESTKSAEHPKAHNSRKIKRNFNKCDFSNRRK
jgi:hypothetical protein